jgi:hypothetical protein
MSSDVLQMLRSRDLCIADLLPRHPELAQRFREGRNRLSRALFHRSIGQRRFGEIASLAAEIGRYDPAFLMGVLQKLPASTLTTLWRRHAPRHRAERSSRIDLPDLDAASFQSTFC